MRGTSTSKSFAVINEVVIRRIVNEAVQTAAAQFAATATTADSQATRNQTADGSNAAGNLAAESTDATVPIPTTTTSRWNANDLGFFDSHYDGKTVHSGAPPIEHTDKNTYFRNVHLFLNRAK